MIRIALFTEGQSELIFSRILLQLVFDPSCLSYQCIKLIGNKSQEVPYPCSPPNPKCHFQIVNVQGDGRLISYLSERIDTLVEKFDLIIGLRDIFSDEYEILSNVISPDAINNLINNQKLLVLKKTDKPHRVKLHYAIMEFEAWILSMPRLFSGIHNELTVEYIDEHLGFDLNTISPQSEFCHPANQLTNILELVNINYKKSWHDIESILCHLNQDILEQLFNEWKSSSFNSFYSEIENIKNASCN